MLEKVFGDNTMSCVLFESLKCRRGVEYDESPDRPVSARREVKFKRILEFGGKTDV